MVSRYLFVYGVCKGHVAWCFVSRVDALLVCRGVWEVLEEVCVWGCFLIHSYRGQLCWYFLLLGCSVPHFHRFLCTCFRMSVSEFRIGGLQSHIHVCMVVFLLRYRFLLGSASGIELHRMSCFLLSREVRAIILSLARFWDATHEKMVTGAGLYHYC